MKSKKAKRFNNHSKIPFYIAEESDEILLAGDKHIAEDTCIIDADREEVIGSSEWLRATEDDLIFIKEACNSYYKHKNLIFKLYNTINDLNKKIEELNYAIRESRKKKIKAKVGNKRPIK